MLRFFKRFINLGEINIGTTEKNKEFYKSIRDLVTILFAIVFGVGLSELGSVKGGSDSAVLSLAYIAILLSWWGYHLGTTLGPPETNLFNSIIDCLLFAVYWYLIKNRAQLSYILISYGIMFFLYFWWELIRLCKEDIVKIKRAMEVNLIFCIIIGYLYPLNNLKLKLYVNSLESIKKWHYICLLYILVIGYRVVIYYVYKIKGD